MRNRGVAGCTSDERGRDRSSAGPDKIGDLTGFGKSPELLLREDEVFIDGDLEDAPTGGNQLGFGAKIPGQLVRQTGGAWFVVSLGAVFDLDTHGRFLL
jgi:hypothetical protein